MVFVETKAGNNPKLERFTFLRQPLAYSTYRKQRNAEAISNHLLADARMRADLLKLRGQDRGVRRLWSRAVIVRSRLRRKLVRLRLEASNATREKRQNASGRVDHMAMAWWKALNRDSVWQRLDPGIWDWEAAYGPVVDRLKPDLIHANDHRMLHVGARAKVRAAARGREIKLVWDAHEWLQGLELSKVADTWLPAQVALQRSFASHADAVVTVSDVLAEMLRDEFDLKVLPSVVVNAPIMASRTDPERSVREVVGLDPDVPLIVYSGAVSAERSVDTVVRALPDLTGVHFVLVAKLPLQPAVQQLLSVAEQLGVRDRVHTAPYVPVDQIVPYLASADVGVHTLLHGPNNEIALPTKFYEYAQARLPVLVSDVKVMAETTRLTGQGEVFEPGDPQDLVRAARLVLGNLPKYRGAFEGSALMDTWTWEAQAKVLDGLYRRTLGVAAGEESG
jgi:glycosyltransferase involved in cell wall biosynthesis